MAISEIPSVRNTFDTDLILIHETFRYFSNLIQNMKSDFTKTNEDLESIFENIQEIILTSLENDILASSVFVI